MVFQILALMALAIFYSCYFIKMFLQKKQGIQTDQIGKGKTGAARLIETAMKVTTICVPIAELVSIVLGTTALPACARAVGVGIAILGDVVFVISVLTMKDSWRAGVSETDKTDLVTNGIYKISRNPAFLGFDLVYIGIILAFFNWVLFAVSVIAIVMFHLQIVFVEEAFLIKAFGDEYSQYKRKTNRYFGRKL